VYRLVVVFRYMYCLFVHGDIVYPLQLGLRWPWWAPGVLQCVGCCQWPGVVGYHNGLLLWPCGHSRLYVVAASGVPWWRRLPYLYLVLECQVGVWPQWYYPGSFNKRISGKGRNGSTEYKILYIHICKYMYIYMYIRVYVQVVVW